VAPVAPDLAHSRLRAADVTRVGVAGLRAHPLRVVLSGVGIAIGIAAMLAVVGISTSSRADLERTLDRLGTNLLTVAATTGTDGTNRLPRESVDMIGRIAPVTAVSAVGRVPGSVYRTDRVPSAQTNSIAIMAARPGVLEAVGARVRVGRSVDEGSGALPTVVLGDAAARRLGLSDPGPLVWLGGQWFGVVGILHPVPLAEELDGAALVSWSAAEQQLNFDGHPTLIYVRSTEPSVEAVRAVLGPTANPAAPNEVQVSRPSDALVAQRATDETLSALLVGLAAVALLVGGIGVANTMVIAVLERRWEIGLRRALGATRGQIRSQFLTESLLLSCMGGAVGVLVGFVVTAGYASVRSWPTVLPVQAMVGAMAATLAIGALSGLYPAIRASRLAPTDALAGT
jgi:putative ABC transport system permease protein